MKQLLSTSENSVLLAYGNVAFLIIWKEMRGDSDHNIQVYQLSSSTASASVESEIQSVVVKKVSDTCFKCAVARHDKSLDIYTVELKQDAEESDGVEQQSNVGPIVTHKSSKRCSSILFASLERTNTDNYERENATNHTNTHSTITTTKALLDILIVGDIGGDVTAFSVSPDTNQEGKHRLLLGHTASILTSIKLVNGRIFSADRDEKIRISTFPQTFQIEGYLLGHDAYITDIDVSKDGTLCVSVSGDSTMRLWNCATFQEMKVVELSEQQDKNGISCLPIKVTMNKYGIVAVIYDECNIMDIFDHELNKVQRITLPSTPLAISFNKKDCLVVSLTDPTFIMIYHKLSGDRFEPMEESQEILSAIKKISNAVKGSFISKTILEKDEHGRNSLMKVMDEKDENTEMPWNRVERIEKQKERARRRKRRKADDVLVESTD